MTAALAETSRSIEWCQRQLPIGMSATLKLSASAPALQLRDGIEAPSASSRLVGGLGDFTKSQGLPRLRPLSGTTGKSARPTATELFRACHPDRRPSSSGSTGALTPTGSKSRFCKLGRKGPCQTATPPGRLPSKQRQTISSVQLAETLAAHFPDNERLKIAKQESPRPRPRALGSAVVPDAWTMPLGSSSASATPASPKIYSGSPTRQIQMQNNQGLMSITSLNRQSMREDLTSPNAAGATTTDKIDAEGFDRDTDMLTKEIIELQRNLNDFEPSADASAQRGSKFKKLISAEGGDDDDEEEKRKERFEIYKFKRSLEPECPPLMKTDPAHFCDVKAKFASSALMQNATRQAIEFWMPTNRKDRLDRKAVFDQTRHEQAIQSKENLMFDGMLRHSASLARKKAQGETALASRRSGKKNAFATLSLDPEVRKDLAQRWLSFLALCAFTKKVRDLRPKRGQCVEEEEGVNPVESTLEGLDEEAKDAAMGRFAVLFALYRSRRLVRKRRTQAEQIAKCLEIWRHDGRTAVCLMRFVKTIRGLQRWWRATSKILRTTREQLSRRWERLEHDAISRELLSDPEIAKAAEEGAKLFGGKGVSSAAATGIFQSGAIRPGGPPRAAIVLEDRIRMDMVTEAQRLTFIEHELRARRFNMLSAIKMWEEDAKKHQAEKDEAKVLKEAMNTLGQEAGPMFRWPPIRPTYLPATHPMSEAKNGLPCPDHCRGRRGDEEVLEWSKRCRKHPRSEGWAKIPRSKGAALVKAGKAKGAASQREDGASKSREVSKEPVPPDGVNPLELAAGAVTRSKQKRGFSKETPFGSGELDFVDVSVEEMKKWGVHPSSMPGF